MRPNPLRIVLLTAVLLSTALLAGCHEPDHLDLTTYQELGYDGTEWPRLEGQTVTILSHGAFGAFDDAKKAFEALTGATVVEIAADDSGSALNRAILESGNPTFDVLYGVDNILFQKALEADVFQPYKPLGADRIHSDYVFFDRATHGWPATPVDHGYVAVNWDPKAADLDIQDLDDVAANAQHFVTQDPRTSTPGLGYLLATIATYGEDGWKEHWETLFDGGVLVTSGWTEAYEQHFTGGYGASYGLSDRAMVTSYTSSPAYERFWNETHELAEVLTAPQSTFHQIETMGIVKGTRNLAAAQAWIEFTLTDAFQSLAAPTMAVYPVVAETSVSGTFGGHDPAPGTFEPAALDSATIGANIDRWVAEWTDLCEAHDCA